MKRDDLIAAHYQDSLAFFESNLFATVQNSAIFTDSKTFVDAIPNAPYEQICAWFDEQSQQETSFQLSAFVQQHFTLPDENELLSNQPGQTVLKHIEQLWRVLHKPQDTINAGTLLPLQHPYIVPGGRFREIYYWDSYFTALGLVKSGHLQLVKDMISNFIQLQQRLGHVPNGNRSYYHTRSQPPILVLLVDLVMSVESDNRTLLRQYVSAIETEYQFWMAGSEHLNATNQSHRRVVLMPDGSLLNRYWDDSATPRPESYREDIELANQLPEAQRPMFYRNVRAACESGWDFSSRWLAQADQLTSIRTTEILPIDLNSLLYQIETQLSRYYLQLDDLEASKQYDKRAGNRAAAIKRYMYCERQGFFFDFDLIAQAKSPVKSLAGIVPLFVQLASETQAAKVATLIENQFLKPGGLVTTLNDSQQQWDSPNGWAPLHWFTVQGLKHYQHHPLASTIMTCWVKTVENFFKASGKLMEKYDVCQQLNMATGGEYQVQEGFGWTNGVTQVFYDELKMAQTT